MKILISGATGMVGQNLYLNLVREGHDVFRLMRSVSSAAGTDLVWDPLTGKAESARFEGFDAVVHLAGESIASGRWTEKRKKRIRESRVIGTKNLTNILSTLKHPPKVYVVASAVGFYGSRDAEVLDEQSKPGTGFLAEVCQEWEAATQDAAQKGIRTVNLRFGIILSPKGGALKVMLCPFKAGAAGIIGDGKQVMSWIALPDAVAIIESALTDTKLQGAVNVVSPDPVTNAVFTQTLGDVLKRPTLIPMPAFAARMAFGEMADALLLSSARVLPKKLQAAGYQFKLPTLKMALQTLLP